MRNIPGPNCGSLCSFNVCINLGFCVTFAPIKFSKNSPNITLLIWEDGTNITPSFMHLQTIYFWVVLFNMFAFYLKKKKKKEKTVALCFDSDLNVGSGFIQLANWPVMSTCCVVYERTSCGSCLASRMTLLEEMFSSCGPTLPAARPNSAPLRGRQAINPDVNTSQVQLCLQTHFSSSHKHHPYYSIWGPKQADRVKPVTKEF